MLLDGYGLENNPVVLVPGGIGQFTIQLYGSGDASLPLVAPTNLLLLWKDVWAVSYLYGSQECFAQPVDPAANGGYTRRIDITILVSVDPAVPADWPVWHCNVKPWLLLPGTEEGMNYSASFPDIIDVSMYVGTFVPSTYAVQFDTSPAGVGAVVDWSVVGGTTSGNSTTPFTISGIASGAEIMYQYQAEVPGTTTKHVANGSAPHAGSITVTSNSTVTWDYTAYHAVLLSTDPPSIGVPLEYSADAGATWTTVISDSPLWFAEAAMVYFTYPAEHTSADGNTLYTLTSVTHASPLVMTGPATVVGTYAMTTIEPEPGQETALDNVTENGSERAQEVLEAILDGRHPGKKPASPPGRDR